MTKEEMTDAIIASKKAKGLSWEEIAEKTGLAPVFVTSACLGMNSMPAENADKLCEALGLPVEAGDALKEFPTKVWDQIVPTDPVLYRFYEMCGVYGPTIKELIKEKFGDGIMSAIDFTMHIDKEENPAGDRVQINISGKFLPYKTW
ncbi:MAG: cyanase [Gammaproteobacteria bacterium]|nr:cyanase [Gammaproteobacteria bacterium]